MSGFCSLLVVVVLFKRKPVLLCADVDALLKKSESQHEPPEDGCPFGPLTQRLLQALVEVRDLGSNIFSSYALVRANSFFSATH